MIFMLSSCSVHAYDYGSHWKVGGSEKRFNLSCTYLLLFRPVPGFKRFSTTFARFTLDVCSAL